jgi:hypothetical protein
MHGQQNIKIIYLHVHFLNVLSSVVNVGIKLYNK